MKCPRFAASDATPPGSGHHADTVNEGAGSPQRRPGATTGRAPGCMCMWWRPLATSWPSPHLPITIENSDKGKENHNGTTLHPQARQMHPHPRRVDVTRHAPGDGPGPWSRPNQTDPGQGHLHQDADKQPADDRVTANRPDTRQPRSHQTETAPTPSTPRPGVDASDAQPQCHAEPEPPQCQPEPVTDAGCSCVAVAAPLWSTPPLAIPYGGPRR